MNWRRKKWRKKLPSIKAVLFDLLWWLMSGPALINILTMSMLEFINPDA